jgi:putative transposase
MSVKTQHTDSYAMYFCTFTCYQWINLFEITRSYDCVYKWFTYLKSKNVDVVCYVIMPNHLHCILYFKEHKFDLNKLIGNAKRFLAYEIIKRLERSSHVDLLNQLTLGITDRESKKGQKHKMFEESFDAKAIFSRAFLKQKVELHTPESRQR